MCSSFTRSPPYCPNSDFYGRSLSIKDITWYRIQKVDKLLLGHRCFVLIFEICRRWAMETTFLKAIPQRWQSTRRSFYITTQRARIQCPHKFDFNASSFSSFVYELSVKAFLVKLNWFHRFSTEHQFKFWWNLEVWFVCLYFQLKIYLKSLTIFFEILFFKTS